MMAVLLATVIRLVLLAIVLVALNGSLAAADGWIDCNGPDKHGRGCSSGRDSAGTAGGLLLIGAVTYGLRRNRRQGGRRGVDRDR